ncbi:unnamed protein product [Penicillium nalgiovense]|uniref:F-box domain-containing protein n=1 Tax=Penicillium nalgiovense TaxID=60175 RepID=A0A9W4HVD6_PENNA|nr:unnamed protein product [Penicillium nalgiovense]CAG8122084.1 unnamed protein product [Penicillium nalgiovense]CAG8127508.1 unnamed protein product [Penicillium nalgiovense]CAG8129948.1 unnamed protein product [Penicillium nalgiovense]CAG8132058.1 unnamed protein product [Penicillium nalgiovense]
MAKASDIHHSCHGRFYGPANVSNAHFTLVLKICSLSDRCQLLKAVPQITGDLSHLPIEVLVEIFNCSNSLDRMCLSLTCKWMLQVSSLVRIRIPSVAKHRFRPPSTCADIFLLFRRIAPRDDSGRIEKSIGLCCDCLRHRTRRRQFWESYKKDWLKMGVTSEHWENAVRSWHVNYSFQCPECWSRERYGNRDRNEGGSTQTSTTRN